MSQENKVIKPQSFVRYEGEPALAKLVATMYASIWNTEGYDIELRKVLTTTLATVPALGIVGHVSGRIQLVHINPTVGSDVEKFRSKLLKELRVAISNQRTVRYNSPITFKIDAKYSGILVFFPNGASKEGRERLPKDGDSHYCCLVYSPLIIFGKNSPPEEEDRFANFQANATIPLFFDVFRHRERRFSSFGVKLAERYWDDSIQFFQTDRRVSNSLFRPPWEKPNNLHRTATLCLDLRKSTFCMEHSDSPELFGEWMDSLVGVITEVCHSHGGIFDKFTGDGGLVHFLENECLEIYKKSAVVCAVECAQAMQEKIIELLIKLRGFIRFDSNLLGAGIAIDLGDTYWSLDHRDNPIVVGRAVVGACRICDGARAGKTRLTNIACKKLPPEISLVLLEKGLRKVNLSTKELDQSMEILVWEF